MKRVLAFVRQRLEFAGLIDIRWVIPTNAESRAALYPNSWEGKDGAPNEPNRHPLATIIHTNTVLRNAWNDFLKSKGWIAGEGADCLNFPGEIANAKFTEALREFLRIVGTPDEPHYDLFHNLLLQYRKKHKLSTRLEAMLCSYLLIEPSIMEYLTGDIQGRAALHNLKELTVRLFCAPLAWLKRPRK